MTKRPHVPRWERVLAWSLRIALVAMAVYHAVIGDLVIAYLHRSSRAQRVVHWFSTSARRANRRSA